MCPILIVTKNQPRSFTSATESLEYHDTAPPDCLGKVAFGHGWNPIETAG